MTQPGKQLVLVTGLSGGGKSTALRALEDLGFYCVDNLPAALLPEFVRQIGRREDEEYARVALGVDARSPGQELGEIPAWLEQLESQGLPCQLLFLTADTRSIITRFSETRRRHPLTGENQPLPQAIDAPGKPGSCLLGHSQLGFQVAFDIDLCQFIGQVSRGFGLS